MSTNTPTDKEARIYARSFVKHGCKTRAFLDTFPKCKASKLSVNQYATRIHKSVNILSMIEKLQDLSKKQTEEEFLFSVSKIKKMLVLAASKGLADREDQFKNKIPVSISGAVSALSELNRMDGNHAAQKIAGHDGGPLESVTMTAEEYMAARQEMLENDDC